MLFICRHIHEKAILLVFFPFVLMAHSKPMGFERKHLLEITALQVLTTAALVDLSVNMITVLTLLTFTLTLTLFEMKHANRKHVALTRLLLMMFLLEHILHSWDPVVSYFNSVIKSNFCSKFDGTAYAFMLKLFRPTYLAIGNMYVYFRLYFNFMFEF